MPTSTTYQYPEHLRQALQDIPPKPGVYTFHPAHGNLPLYIGKSINLRARLLSHLRNPAEARMLQQTARISYERTAGDIGAQLLEAQLIKQHQPLFNKKLRRNRQLCALQLQGEQVHVVDARDIDFATTHQLYGLYSSRTAAQQALRALADTHQLCYVALGLEKRLGTRGCFRASLQQCRGVCCGRESTGSHLARLHSALQDLHIAVWPYDGAVGLEERSDDLRQIHVVRNWCYLGSASDVRKARRLGQVAVGFDADGYKILCRPILTAALPILVL